MQNSQDLSVLINVAVLNVNTTEVSHKQLNSTAVILPLIGVLKASMYVYVVSLTCIHSSRNEIIITINAAAVVLAVALLN